MRARSPASWPNATFELPPHQPADDAYRLQLLVTPKANGCEEFWAQNPSGRGTNGSCGGLSTGEPYRELRVFVDGQLAGLAPLYYTMYTGGVDPRLWQGIVAHPTFQLPVYRFDLSAWAGVLNSPAPALAAVQQPGARQQQGQQQGSRGHTITVELLGDRKSVV